jgi:hypothetical protein
VSTPNITPPTPFAASRKDLEERGFVDYCGGSVLRRFYPEFVIDAKLAIFNEGYQDLELRAGSAAPRIHMQLSSLADLDCLLAMIERHQRSH